MARSVGSLCVSEFGRRLAVGLLLLAGVTLGAQSYQSNFTEVKYKRNASPSLVRGGVEVEIATGLASMNIPLGPGIGARGARFAPTLSAQWFPQARYVPHSASGMAGQSAISNSCNETGLLSPGFLDINSSTPAAAGGCLPGGQTVNFERVAPTALTGDDLQKILTDFKVSGTVFQGTQGPLYNNNAKGELLIALTDGASDQGIGVQWKYDLSNGEPPVEPPGGGTHLLPRRMLVVTGDSAYLFEYDHSEYLKKRMVNYDTGPGYAPKEDAPFVEDWLLLKKSTYQLVSIRDRFEGEIKFKYTVGGLGFGGFTATWLVAEKDQGVSISVTSTPPPNSSATVQYSGPAAFTYTYVFGGGGTQSGAFLSQDPTNYWWRLPDGKMSEYLAVPIRPQVNGGEPHSLTFPSGESMQWSYVAGAVPSGIPECIAGCDAPRLLSKVTMPGREIRLQWGSYGYALSQGSMILGEVRLNTCTPAWAWGVTQLEDVDTATQTSRATRYERTLPLPKIEWRGLAASGSFFITDWMTRDFRTRVVHPDGSSAIYTYPSVPVGIATPTTGSNAWNIQALTHLRHELVSEERFSPSGRRYLVRGMDRWDVRSLLNSSAVLESNTTPKPTRVRILDVVQGTLTTQESLNWDATNFGWQTHLEVVQGGITAPESTAQGLLRPDLLGLAYTGTITASYPADKGAIRETTLTFDTQLSNWLISREKSRQTVTKADSTGFLAPGADLSQPLESRSQTFVDGFSTVQQMVQCGKLTTDFSYKGIKGLGASQIGTVTVTEAGRNLSGLVGIASYEYDPQGRLCSIQPKGVDWSVKETRDAYGRVTEQEDANGLKTQFHYDTAGRIYEMVPPGGEQSTTYTYDPDFLGVIIQQGLKKSQLRYNGFGELILERRFTPAGDSYRTFGLDLMGRRVWETTWAGASGSEAAWTSDLAPDDTIKPGGNGACLEWTTEENPKTHVMVKTCLTYEVLPDRTLFKNSTHFRYDDLGRLIESVNPNGEAITTEYSAAPTASGTSWKKVTTGRSGNGGPIVNTSASATTMFETDPLGRLGSVTDALGRVTEYRFDAANRVVKVVQWSGAAGTLPQQERTWHYTDLGRLDRLTQPESGTTTYSDFDVNGKPWTTVYGFDGPAPKPLLGTFDLLGRPLSAMGTGVAQGFAYDEGGAGALANGKLTTATANGMKRTLGYNGPKGRNGRLTTLTRTVDGMPDFVQSFGYDTYGRMDSRTYPDGKTQAIHHQEATDLPDTTDFYGARLANLKYDPTSWNLMKLAYANGASSDFTYGADQTRLATMGHTIPSLVFPKAWTYSYDRAGRLITDGEDSYTYDPLGRLKTAAVVDPWGTKGLFQTFDYDAFGNRSLAKTETADNWVLPKAMPLTVIPLPILRSGLDKVTANVAFKSADLSNNQLPATAYLPNGTPVDTGAHYDAQGNLDRLYTTPGDTNTQVNLTYDALGRVSILTTKVGTEDYLHDDEGLRIKVYERATGKTRYNIYNEARQLIAQYEKVGTGSLTWKKNIVYVGTKEIAEISSTGTSITMTDHLGSPRLIWNGTAPIGGKPDGVNLIVQKFLPFGEQLTPSGVAAGIAKGFTNHEQTDASGLIYMQARMYLPAYGRFASPDPGKDQHFEDTQSWNIYSYCRNEPVMSTDPTGMFDWNLKTRAFGVLKMAGGGMQLGASYAVGIASARLGVGAPVIPLVAAVGAAKGSDNMSAGFQQFVSGQHVDNVSTQAIQGMTGMSIDNARLTDAGFDFALSLSLGAAQFKINGNVDFLSGKGSLNTPMEITEGRAAKIFGTREGHLPDTPANRTLLTDVANDSKAVLGADKYGNQWSARLLPDGTQAWTQTRNGQIWNGGLNQTPREFNPETGLAALTKPRGN